MRPLCGPLVDAEHLCKKVLDLSELLITMPHINLKASIYLCMETVIYYWRPSSFSERTDGMAQYTNFVH